MVNKQSLVPGLMEFISLWGAQEMRNQKITMPMMSAGMGGVLGALGAHLDFTERQRRHPVEMARGLLGKEQHAPWPRDKRKYGSSVELKKFCVASEWSVESRAAWICSVGRGGETKEQEERG